MPYLDLGTETSPFSICKLYERGENHMYGYGGGIYPILVKWLVLPAL